MTQKELLLKKRYELQNELKALRGEETINLEEMIGSWRFNQQAKEERVYSLQMDVQRLTKEIETQKAKNERKARNDGYYSTERGKAMKEYLEKLRETETGRIAMYQSESLNNFKQWIKEFLGEHWSVSHFDTGRVDFRIRKADNSDFVFGSEIEVRYEKESWLNDGKERFETNIGAMGSFGILDQDPESRCRFYMDLGKFLSNKEKLQELKELMKSYETTLVALRDHIRMIDHQLENPIIDK